MSRAYGQLRIIVLMLACFSGGCTHVGDFVWVDAYKGPPSPSSPGYVIAPGDLLNVRVWNQEAMSARVRVRGDGMISLPFLNDVEAAGNEPPVLAKRLQVKLKDFIVNPVVTVALDEPAPLEVSVVGEVAKPGVYKVEPDAGVLNVLAAASGLTQYASRERIFVLRRAQGVGAQGEAVRIRFTYDALSRVEGAAAKFRLRKGDVLVVE